MNSKTMLVETQDFEEQAETEEIFDEAEPKKRFYPPRLDTLEDIHRQIKRLYAEATNRHGALSLPLEQLRIASGLLPLARSVIAEIEANAEDAAHPAAERGQRESRKARSG